MTTLDVFFTIIGLLCAASAILAVTTKHIIHAALWLTVALGTLAGCYLVLGAELVALVQLIVYVGAVVVLVIFALMVTRAPIGRSTEHDTSMAQRAGALIVSSSAVALVGAVLLAAFGGQRAHVRGSDTAALATQIFTTWAWPFEALSLLLLIALVTAIALSRMPIRRVGEPSTASAVGEAAASEGTVSETAASEAAR